MQLETQENNYCVLCLEVPPDPSREDHLCNDCGAISDKYNFGEEQLNLLEED